MQKRRIQRTTGFAVGVAGAAVTLAAGILVAMGTGPATLLFRIAFAFLAIMILLLSVTERGPENNRVRLRFFLVFMALVVANLGLPPLDCLEAIVVPLIASVYVEKRADSLFILALWVVEIAYAVVRMVAITSYFGQHQMLALGIAVIVVALARGVVLVRLFIAARKQPPLMNEDATRRL